MAESSHDAIPSQSEAWLRAILASTLDPVITIDEFGIIQLASQSMVRVFGWTPEELIGENIKILMPEPHRSRHDGYLERYRRTGETVILGKAREFEAVRKDGSVFPCEISVSRVDLPVTSKAVLTGIIRDVSERKDAQRKLEELNRALEEKNRVLETIVFNAEKLASMGKLAASIAHEIRNPLTSLKVRLFSIRRAIGPNPVLEEKFRVVSEEIDRLEGVVRNFLEFSRPPALKLQPYEVSVLVERTLALFGHQFEENETEFVCSLEPGLPPVIADMEQLKQVLMNLWSNALEAMQGGGRIAVSAKRATDSKGRSMVVLRVEDTGPGIPEEVAPHVFEPFFSTKEEGTGLGLCISAQIVERHGGRLTLEATGPKGTCFALWIPVANERMVDRDSHGQNPHRG